MKEVTPSAEAGINGEPCCEPCACVCVCVCVCVLAASTALQTNNKLPN